MLTLKHRRRVMAFTLVEMLVVLGIIALMANLAYPAFSAAMNKAKSVKCSANLRAIGIAVSLAATDNNNTYPEINQTAPPLPYASSVQGLVGVLGPYGITTNAVQCPIDMGNGGASAFTQYGSSYEWTPAFDDEAVNATVIYITPGMAIPVNSSRVRLCSDFNGVHRGRQNVVYGDGHVTTH
jgi:prepilin-type N-terminal cleavage/methylation domain-containing protein/prepilin-type processing-associated H-X9-DG protein